MIYLVGPFPPPMHGMGYVNDSVRKLIENRDINYIVYDTSGKLDNSILHHTTRFFKVILHLVSLIFKKDCSHKKIYISISSGYGQIYELLFILVSRVRNIQIFLHHHSFLYIKNKNFLTSLLMHAAGESAYHFTQSNNMSKKLAEIYYLKNTDYVSNSAFLNKVRNRIIREKIKKIGFLSNICEEKGIYDFIEIANRIHKKFPKIKWSIGGEFHDNEIKKDILEKIKPHRHIEYQGFLDHNSKRTFLKKIDLFIFPSKHEGETEGIVNHEAMSYSIPVIAPSIGCIPEFLDNESGIIIYKKYKFVQEATFYISDLLKKNKKFSKLSKNAYDKFNLNTKINKKKLKYIFENIIFSD